MTIRNKPKRTISARGEFGLLQMVSGSNTEWCASEDAGLPRGWIVRSHVGWKGKEPFLTRVCKSLSSIRVLNL